VILGDSTYFVALANREDRWHRDAVRVSKSLRDRIVVTDLTVAESVTLVGSRTRAKGGMSLFQYFFDDCDVVFANEDLLRSAMSHWLRYDGRLSVPDCVSIEVMSRRSISRLLSFDSDFDRVRGIDRVH
jgi:predicted nucleic acid-binding protein